MPLSSSSTEDPGVPGSWLPGALLQLCLWPVTAMCLSHPLKTSTLPLPALGRIWGGVGGWTSSHSRGQGKVH